MSQGTYDSGSTSVFNTGYIGTDNSSEYLNGYIDEFRATSGLARYTGNVTPPNAPFPDQ